MTYLEAISNMRAKLRVYGFKEKLSDEDLMMFLSEAQNGLNRKYLLVEKRATVAIVSGKVNYGYADGIPADILQIVNAYMDDSVTTPAVVPTPSGIGYTILSVDNYQIQIQINATGAIRFIPLSIEV